MISCLRKTIEIQMAYPNNLKRRKEVANSSSKKNQKRAKWICIPDDVNCENPLDQGRIRVFRSRFIIAGNSICNNDGRRGEIGRERLILGSRLDLLATQRSWVGIAFEITMRPVLAEPTIRTQILLREDRERVVVGSPGFTHANQDGFNYTSSGESRTSSGSR